MMPIITYKKLNRLYYIFNKKNLEISFQNELEHETTFLILPYDTCAKTFDESTLRAWDNGRVEV